MVNSSTLKMRDDTTQGYTRVHNSTATFLPYLQVFAAGFPPVSSGPGEGGRRVGAPGDAPGNTTEQCRWRGSDRIETCSALITHSQQQRLKKRNLFNSINTKQSYYTATSPLQGEDIIHVGCGVWGIWCKILMVFFFMPFKELCQNIIHPTAQNHHKIIKVVWSPQEKASGKYWSICNGKE